MSAYGTWTGVPEVRQDLITWSSLDKNTSTGDIFSAREWWMSGTHSRTTWKRHGMYRASSAFTGAPGWQQASHDVRYGRQKNKRNGRHTIQTSSSWFYMGRRGFLYKYTSKYLASKSMGYLATSWRRISLASSMLPIVSSKAAHFILDEKRHQWQLKKSTLRV